MKVELRWIVAIVVVFFSWKGANVGMEWTPLDPPQKPAVEMLNWAEGLKTVLPRMILKDRQYLSSLYEAMAFVLINDGERAEPIISDTGKFVSFHTATLNLAIKRESVGKYAGLGEAIDQTFLSAIGPDSRKIDAEVRKNLVAACGVLSWAFAVGSDG